MVFGQVNLGCIPDKNDMTLPGLHLWNTSIFGDIAPWQFHRIWFEVCEGRSTWDREIEPPIDISRC